MGDYRYNTYFMGMEVKVEGALKSSMLCEEARECMV